MWPKMAAGQSLAYSQTADIRLEWEPINHGTQTRTLPETEIVPCHRTVTIIAAERQKKMGEQTSGNSPETLVDKGFRG
jgi:hypothetical protein